MKKNKIALYARKSTDEKSDNRNSIKNQKAAVKKFAQKHGWKFIKR